MDASGVYGVADTIVHEAISCCAVVGRENVEGAKHIEAKAGCTSSWFDQDLGKIVPDWHTTGKDVSENEASFEFDTSASC